MAEQHEFPDGKLAAAVEEVLPQTRRDMDADEILEFLEENPELLRQKLRDFGAPPEYYEELPSIIRADGETAKATELLTSGGPLWPQPSEETDVTEGDEQN